MTGMDIARKIPLRDEVIEALERHHLKVARRCDDNGWCALVVKKA